MLVLFIAVSHVINLPNVLCPPSGSSTGNFFSPVFNPVSLTLNQRKFQSAAARQGSGKTQNLFVQSSLPFSSVLVGIEGKGANPWSLYWAIMAMMAVRFSLFYILRDVLRFADQFGEPLQGHVVYHFREFHPHCCIARADQQFLAVSVH